MAKATTTGATAAVGGLWHSAGNYFRDTGTAFEVREDEWPIAAHTLRLRRLT